MDPIVCLVTPAMDASCSCVMFISARASLNLFLNFSLSFTSSPPYKETISYLEINVKPTCHLAKSTCHSVIQEELADALEVSRQTIGSLENGRYNPSIFLAFKIAHYFGKTIEEVFIFEEEIK